MQEIWKDIEGYEGLYQVSNLGRIKSLNYLNTGITKIMKQNLSGNYATIGLCKKGKVKTRYIHRLVAETFIPNTDNYLEVNHKDENKQNNRVDNLEWCTRKYNINYGTHNQRMIQSKIGTNIGENNPFYGKHHNLETREKISESHKGIHAGAKHPNARKIICITTGEIFDYIKQASDKYNIDNSSITKCCKGKIKHIGKHPITNERLAWKYYDEL